MGDSGRGRRHGADGLPKRTQVCRRVSAWVRATALVRALPALTDREVAHCPLHGAHRSMLSGRQGVEGLRGTASRFAVRP